MPRIDTEWEGVPAGGYLHIFVTSAEARGFDTTMREAVEGTVIALGPQVTLEVQQGEEVLFPSSPDAHPSDGCYLVHQTDILGVRKPRSELEQLAQVKEEKPPPAPLWKRYKTYRGTEEGLNELAEDGWEIVSASVSTEKGLYSSMRRVIVTAVLEKEVGDEP